MEITLNYLGKTGGGTVRVYCAVPTETVGVNRIERKYGAPVMQPVRKQTRQLLVGPDGLLNLELTKLNCAAIKKLTGENGDFELLDPDQMALVDAMLGGTMPEPAKEPQVLEKRGRGRPTKKAPAQADVPPTAANIVSA